MYITCFDQHWSTSKSLKLLMKFFWGGVGETEFTWCMVSPAGEMGICRENKRFGTECQQATSEFNPLLTKNLNEKSHTRISCFESLSAYWLVRGGGHGKADLRQHLYEGGFTCRYETPTPRSWRHDTTHPVFVWFIGTQSPCLYATSQGQHDI
jgi:hypothetical protein